MHVAVDGARLFFDALNPKLALTTEGYEEKPTLVCVHGGPGGDHMGLRPEIDALTPHAHVLLFDQRGGGRSERGDPASWTLDRWADDVAALCATLGVEKPILFGFSGGAAIALRCAARHPDLPAGLVLAAPGTGYDAETLIADFARRGGPQAAVAARAMFARCAPEDFPPFAQYCLPLYAKRRLPDAATRRARSIFGAEANRRFFGPGGEAWRLDLADDTARVRCPTLVISGADDPIHPASMGETIAASVPNGRGRFELFEEASHAVMSDAPERFTAAVAAFIEGLSTPPS